MMKKLLGGFALSVFLAAPVMAADLPARMPVKAPPPPIVTLYSWTGCYIGGHVGYAWGRTEIDLPPGVFLGDLDHDSDGFIAGGQLGCNIWQNDRWVLGIEGQAAWADIDGDLSTFGQTVGLTGVGTRADIIGSISARLGYAVGASGQTLLYVKGGAAFINEQFTATLVGPVTFETDKQLRWGWMVGAGFEQALGANWSFKAEYNFSHFGSDSFDICVVGAACASFDTERHVHLVKVGINYRFGGGWGAPPVAARY
jgi:outer membrane immunogenic protein